ncbi:hypothetical protein [Nocardia jiangsuensis]|uniref:ATP-binding protein n=1 Tax=Nocardia jiangsuensis TaxID=1691563 RepID=A0ABV8E0Q8_9NOCA
MTPLFGPFDVKPEQITRLGDSFTAFVNRLLDTEHSAARQAGATLVTNFSENTPDGGVDAAVTRSVGSEWIPAGESVWQFKKGDLAPGMCRQELRGALWAQERIRHGAQYRLVVGKALTARCQNNRKSALIAEAKSLKLPCDPDLFEVIDANKIARWAESFPALAVSSIVGGAGQIATDFEVWSSSSRHQSDWVEKDRIRVIEELRKYIDTDAVIRVSGVSGVGKTRTVLEAIRGHDQVNLVAYIGESDSLSSAVYIQDLAKQGRAAIVVADQCDSQKHETLASALPSGSRIKLVTIGDAGNRVVLAPQVQISAMTEEAISMVLASTKPALWSEANRVVARLSAGNIFYALWLADRVIEDPSVTTQGLVSLYHIRNYVSGLINESSFDDSAPLALFGKIGWDGELEAETRLIADALEIDHRDLRKAGRALEKADLLTRRGRYRAVTPNAAAIYLASDAWQTYRHQIVTNLIPSLNADLAYRLFERAADIGRFEPTERAVHDLLVSNAAFGNLEQLESGKYSDLLPSLAIISPDAISSYLTRMVDRSEDDVIRSLRGIRRNLVWTLQKLAWHSRFFVKSADSLLKLALNENEQWSDNATEVWIGLFGTILPLTSAGPEIRLQYLAEMISDPRVSVRSLAVRAAGQAMRLDQFASVSGEIQGGVFVERRGVPEFWHEAFSYQIKIIELLRKLSDDTDVEIAQAALAALIESIHPALEIPPVLEALTDALSRLQGSAVHKVRIATTSLDLMFRSVEESGLNTDSESLSVRREGLRKLVEMLPEMSSIENLRTLLGLRYWDLQPGELRTKISEALKKLDEVGERPTLALLLTDDLKASGDLGYALGEAWGIGGQTESVLAAQYDSHSEVLVGYLRRSTQDSPDAFIRFLRGPHAEHLNDRQKLAVAVRAPFSREIMTLVSTLADIVSPAYAANMMAGWVKDIDLDEVFRFISGWFPRIQSQEDYNAVLDFTSVILINRADDIAEFEGVLTELVMMRRHFPQLRHSGHDWARVVQCTLPVGAVTVADMLLELIESSQVGLYVPDEDKLVLTSCLAARLEAVWESIISYLERGSWRVEMSTRGWLIKDVRADFFDHWISEDRERGRIVAMLAYTGSEDISEIAVLLLTRFPQDETISAALYGNFVSSEWAFRGHSERIEEQIQVLEKWASRYTGGVRQWAVDHISGLREQRTYFAQRDDERY